MEPKLFVQTYLPFAKQTETKTGISHLVILAQAALESGWGKYAPGNMLFGIKANTNTPEDKRQLITTTEFLSTPNIKFPEIISVKKQPNGQYKYIVKDWFRKYETPEEGFTDHANFFLTNPRYKEALKFKNDPYKFAEEIAKAGYATDPNYSKTLKSMVDSIKKRIV